MSSRTAIPQAVRARTCFMVVEAALKHKKKCRYVIMDFDKYSHCSLKLYESFEFPPFQHGGYACVCLLMKRPIITTCMPFIAIEYANMIYVGEFAEVTLLRFQEFMEKLTLTVNNLQVRKQRVKGSPCGGGVERRLMHGLAFFFSPVQKHQSCESINVAADTPPNYPRNCTHTPRTSVIHTRAGGACNPSTTTPRPKITTSSR
ncbi:hypothetical protein EVAR_36201_1 [Eumeta japonica]|uniref:Uncharacterized protein n=1 Tax=Eumeta variegata TaxID=151549 RepID=A0A4C1VUE5_EUMVA|nr:hypothetical protein EVAR_36201_1 [Eumeta japonica]